MEIRVIPMEVSILSEGESALYVPLMPKIRRPGAIAPKRLYIKPHVSYDLLVYGATRKRGFVKEGIPTLVPGSFGIVGLNFARCIISITISGQDFLWMRNLTRVLILRTIS